jgi:hypothetical protein
MFEGPSESEKDFSPPPKEAAMKETAVSAPTGEQPVVAAKAKDGTPQPTPKEGSDQKAVDPSSPHPDSLNLNGEKEVPDTPDADVKGDQKTPEADSAVPTPEEAQKKKVQEIEGKIDLQMENKVKSEITREIEIQFLKDTGLAVPKYLEIEGYNGGEDEAEKAAQLFLAQHRAEIDGIVTKKVESELTSRMDEAKKNLMAGPIDEGLAVITGEKIGTPKFEQKKKSLLAFILKETAQGTTTWAKNFAKDVLPHGNFGDLISFLLDPVHAGHSGGGLLEKENPNEIGKDEFTNNIDGVEKRKDFMKALRKTYDKTGGLKEQKINLANVEGKWKAALDGDPDAMHAVMKEFLSELFKDKEGQVSPNKIDGNKAWEYFRAEIVKQWMPNKNQSLSKGVGQLLLEMNEDEERLSHYFPKADQATDKKAIPFTPAGQSKAQQAKAA